MSLYIYHYTKKHALISADTRLCGLKDNSYYKIHDNACKIINIYNKVFTFGGDYFTVNILIDLIYKNNYDSIELLSTCKQLDHKYNINKDNYFIELSWISYENNHNVLYNIATYNNYEIIIQESEDNCISSFFGGIEIDKANNYYNENVRNMDIIDLFKNIYNLCESNFIGGDLVIYEFTKGEMIKMQKYPIYEKHYCIIGNQGKFNKIEMYNPSNSNLDVEIGNYLDAEGTQKRGIKIANGSLEIVGGIQDSHLSPTVSNSIAQAQTDANTANSLLADIADDNKLTPVEKQAVKKEWDIIQSEKSSIDAQATNYGLTTEKANYNSAYITLLNYIQPLLSDLNTTSELEGIGEQIIYDNEGGNFLIPAAEGGVYFRTKFKEYYDAKIALLNGVSNKLKSTSVQLGQAYNNLKFDSTTGITATRSDNKIRTSINATDGIKISKGSGDGNFTSDVLSIDTNGNAFFGGTVKLNGLQDTSGNNMLTGTKIKSNFIENLQANQIIVGTGTFLDSKITDWDNKETTTGSQDKATLAQSNAISTASADATTKANSAKTNAVGDIRTALNLTGSLPTTITMDNTGIKLNTQIPSFVYGTSYAKNDFVQFSGNVYRCILATSTNYPSGTTSDALWWKYVSSTSILGQQYCKMDYRGLFINNGAIQICSTDGETFIDGNGVKAEYLTGTYITGKTVRTATENVARLELNGTGLISKSTNDKKTGISIETGDFGYSTLKFYNNDLALGGLNYNSLGQISLFTPYGSGVDLKIGADSSVVTTAKTKATGKWDFDEAYAKGLKTTKTINNVVSDDYYATQSFVNSRLVARFDA